MRIRLIKVLWIGFFIFLTTTLGYCFRDTVIAIVNDEVITKAELDTHVQLLKMQIGEEGWRQYDMSEEKALLSLIEDRLVVQEAIKQELEVDDREVDNRVKRMRERFGSEEEFNSMLMQQGISLTGFRERIKEQMISEEFINREIRSRIIVGPKEVTDFYNNNLDDFSLPERAEIDSIVVTDKLLAEDIFVKLRLGLDFDTVKEYYKEKNGINGIVKKGELRKDIDDEIFSLKEGEFSAPIEIEGRGNFIFFVRNKFPRGEQKKLIEVQDQIRNYLAEKKFQDKLQKLLTKLKEKSYIEIKDE